MDAATPAAVKELKRIISFVLKTKHYGLKIEPKHTADEWYLTIYSDSDWAGDKDNRHSISGFIIFFLGVPVMWKSKAQKAIALSSSEAEYYAMSEAAKEIRFIVMLLESMNVQIKKPIIVYADNIGAIFMSENASATSRTRHVDARYHFVREFVEEGFLKIVFVKTTENKSDMFTKNVSGEIYDAHVNDFVMSRTDVGLLTFEATEEGCQHAVVEYGSNVSQVHSTSSRALTNLSVSSNVMTPSESDSWYSYSGLQGSTDTGCLLTQGHRTDYGCHSNAGKGPVIKCQQYTSTNTTSDTDND
jgi:hypothetical protein